VQASVTTSSPSWLDATRELKTRRLCDDVVMTRLRIDGQVGSTNGAIPRGYAFLHRERRMNPDSAGLFGHAMGM
jgi:hypothetical protein